MGDVARLRRWLGACALAALFALLPSVAGAAAPAQAADTGWKPLLLRGTGLQRLGPHLYLDGSPYRFTGVNAYELATDWSINFGCGAQVNNIDGFFASLPAHSMVRIAAIQAFAVNKVTRRIDWLPYDRVVTAAARYHDLLIMSLESQAGTCDDGIWHEASWYEGGYQTVHNANQPARDIMSYLSWVKLVVARYARQPVVAMWEPMGEAEASSCAPGLVGSACYGHLTCPTGAYLALRHFFDAVGALIHRMDPGHLVAAGLLGGQQCGTAGTDFLKVAASPGIDVLTFHDYGRDQTAVQPDLAMRISQAAALDKPLFVEESGILASSAATGCVSRTERAALVRRKAGAAIRDGLSGWMIWNWVPSPQAGCSMDVGPGDPSLAVLRSVISPSLPLTALTATG
jgi:mannan endo-1,4-beta-mannosidase